MKEWMAAKKWIASTAKKWMAGHYFFLEIKWHTTLKNGRLRVVFFSKYIFKIYCLYKNLMLQIDPLNSSCSQKVQCPEKKVRL